MSELEHTVPANDEQALALENQLLREWCVLADTLERRRRWPHEVSRDWWRSIRRQPTLIGQYDRELQLTTMALAALVKKALARGGLSSKLQSRIITDLAHEKFRRMLVRVPEEEMAAAELVSSIDLIPFLGEVVETAGMLHVRLLWEWHMWHLAGSGCKVLVERGEPDPIDVHRAAKAANRSG